MEKFGRVCKEYMIKEMVERFQSYPDFFITSFSRVGVGDTEVHCCPSLRRDRLVFAERKRNAGGHAPSRGTAEVALDELADLLIVEVTIVNQEISELPDCGGIDDRSESFIARVLDERLSMISKTGFTWF